MCYSLFFSTVSGLRSATLLKKRLLHRCFPVNFEKFFSKHFFIEHLRRLFLKVFRTAILQIAFEMRLVSYCQKFTECKREISENSRLALGWNMLKSIPSGSFFKALFNILKVFLKICLEFLRYYHAGNFASELRRCIRDTNKNLRWAVFKE